MNERREKVAQVLDYIKAQYQIKYGMEMDDWSAVNLAESREQFETIRKHLDESLKENKKLQQAFRGPVVTVAFSSSWQSFAHGVGRSLPHAACALILGMLCYFYLRAFQLYQGISSFVSEMKNFESYKEVIREGTIITESGVEFLILKPAKTQDYYFGKVFEFDAKRRELRVPLRRLN